MCNTIVKAFVGYNDLGSAIGVYYWGIVEKGVRPNHYTLPILLKVCAEMGWFREGEKSHGRFVKFGFGDDVFVRNSMIYMYASLQRMRFACKVFDESPNSDFVTCNSMIDEYVRNGDVGIARDFFNEMPKRDIVSWNTMIVGYMSIGNMDAAEEVFERMGVRDIVS
ncbi:hypothetical protein GIB67_021750 [Kingdonia uniflora]|uniref:Pentatricopeptide repeat-containing protein n=1 Tax=Kingdonia uniflora TaxID=39325 RepID=A0A7J7M9W1_9MAGN|nr:hypothetical protein GIB67_021750 [Kingdonia uniflora]